jgi:glutathione S-transferase
MSLFWGYWRTPEADRNERRNQLERRRCREYLAVLDGWLADRPYLAGDALSLADIPAGALMYRYVHLDVTDDLPPNVAGWYDRLTERAPFRTHIMLPFDALKGRLRP